MVEPEGADGNGINFTDGRPSIPCRLASIRWREKEREREVAASLSPSEEGHDVTRNYPPLQSGRPPDVPAFPLSRQTRSGLEVLASSNLQKPTSCLADTSTVKQGDRPRYFHRAAERRRSFIPDYLIPHESSRRQRRHCTYDTQSIFFRMKKHRSERIINATARTQLSRCRAPSRNSVECSFRRSGIKSVDF